MSLSQKLITDNLKAMLKNALLKEMKEYKKEDAKLFFVWQKETNSVGLHMISKKYDVEENSVLSRPVKSLSSLMSVMQVASYKAMGFNVDKEAMGYIEKFYKNYCKNLNIECADCNFYIALEKGDVVAVFNPQLKLGLSAKRVEISDMIKIGGQND